MPSHTISVLVENEFGVLSRVAGLFSSRGFNIESLTVNEDPLDPTVSRMVVVATGDDQILEQINKQLNKLVSVIKVTDFKEVETVDRELIMVNSRSTSARAWNSTQSCMLSAPTSWISGRARSPSK
jgi:acetolactate synthase-1/3 small subunit